MKNIFAIPLFSSTLVLLLFAALSPAITTGQSIKVTVTNPSDFARRSENIVLQIPALKAVARDFDAASARVVVRTRSTPAEKIVLPSQVDDIDGDQKPDELVFQIDLEPLQIRNVMIEFGGTERAVIHPLRTSGRFAAKFEGPGWESDINAWRLYFDKRNAIDLFGKRRPGLSLEVFGRQEHNYHEESPYGRDIYKIGNALGIGAIGALVDGKVIKVAEVTDRSWRIVSSGPVRTIVELNYKGWQVAGRSIDLMSRMTVWAGERGFEHRIVAKNAEGLTFVTGLPRKPGLSEVTAKEIGSNLPIVATWGDQVLKTGATATESLPDQNLGLVIVLAAPAPSSSSLPADADNILASVPLNQGTAHWYVAAAWDQERSEKMEMPAAGNSTSKHDRSELPQPVRNREEFVIYVKELSDRLATAPIAQISQKTIPRSN
jgi:hypothetical protein